MMTKIPRAPPTPPGISLRTRSWPLRSSSSRSGSCGLPVGRGPRGPGRRLDHPTFPQYSKTTVKSTPTVPNFHRSLKARCARRAHDATPRRGSAPASGAPSKARRARRTKLRGRGDAGSFTVPLAHRWLTDASLVALAKSLVHAVRPEHDADVDGVELRSQSPRPSPTKHPART